MRITLFTGCMLASVAAAAPAGAQTQEQIDWCVNDPKRFSADLSIGGCTAAIQSGRWSGSNLAWAFSNRCVAYNEQKEFDRAIADCEEAIRLDPMHPNAHYNRGNAYLNKGDNVGAIVAFNEAIRVNPNDASAFANRALAYERKGDIALAIADFRRALALGDTLSADDLRRLGAAP